MKPEVTVVIPVYNEGEGIYDVLLIRILRAVQLALRNPHRLRHAGLPHRARHREGQPG